MKIALLTASGIGSRTGQDIPKQFIHVDNVPIIIHTLRVFQNSPEIDQICVVILKGWEQMLRAYSKQFNITKLTYIVNGGDSGQKSILNGLREIKKSKHDDDIVMIHDGNRPLVDESIIKDSLKTFEQYGNAVAAIPCTEVVFKVKNKDDKVASEPIDRDYLRRTQTPHTYKLKEILDLYELASAQGVQSAASCDLMSHYGKKSFFSKGSEKNLKITTTEDLEIFKALLHANNDDWIK